MPNKISDFNVDTPLGHKSRFIRFTPTVTMGNLITAIAIIIGAVTAWVQLNTQVGNLAVATKATADLLATENSARKSEIRDSVIKQDIDRAELYKKIAQDHDETQLNIEKSQKVTHDDIREIATALATRFDRIEDKLDKKQDKK